MKPVDLDGDYDSGGGTENAGSNGLFASLGPRTKRLILALLRVPIIVLQAPFLLVRGIFLGGKRELLFLLPAILTIGFCGFVFFQVFVQGQRIQDRYRIGAIKAMQAGNFELAKTYLSRVGIESELSEYEQLQWSVILGQTGATIRSQQIFDELAPDDQARFPPAHRMKAVVLAAQLEKASDPMILRKLRHHLESSRDDSLETKQAWAAYYLAVDQTEKALDYLRAISKLHPRYLLTIANIHERSGREKQKNQALEQAEIAFRDFVDRDPLDSTNRISLANVLVQMKKFDQAEQLLAQGLRLQPDPIIKRATADFYVLGYDMAVQQGRDFSKRLAFLQRALALDANHVAVYIRLVSLYQKESTAEESQKIKQALMESVAGDKPSAMAHFALSNVLWMEGNHSESEWHIEQAYKLQFNFAIVINNLAWMLAHKEEPDLDRALELAEMAVKQSPSDSRFQGTYGTVLLLQKKYEDAITPLQKAIPNNPAAKSIHEKLAKCYQVLGKLELAEIHLKKARPE